jgi:DNA polymerase-3 subunit delta'
MELFEGSDAKSISHAVIVWGGSEADRNADAYTLARAAVCSAPVNRPCMTCPHCLKSARGTHPDIIIVDRREDKQNILVDQIRAVREDAVVMPNEANKKAYIIHQAGLMNTQAQNAFLKLLEEPPESSGFILVAEDPVSLLPTVRSRCVEIQSRRQEARQADSKLVSAFEEALTGGVLRLNAFSYTLEKLDRNSFPEFLDGASAMLIRRLRGATTGGDNSLDTEYLMNGIRVLARAKEYFNSNVSLVHISGMICAALMPIEK